MIPRLLEMFFVMFIGLSIAGYSISWDVIYFIGSARMIYLVMDFMSTTITKAKEDLKKKPISKACIHGHENWDDCPDCGH